MEDIARLRPAIEATGTQVAFVHMQPPAEADAWFARHGLEDVPRFSDPSHAIYRAFDLREGSALALLHPRVWLRWAKTTLTRGAGQQGEHWRQLTGMFLIEGGQIRAELRHRNSAARPDYLAFVRSGLRRR